MVACRSSSTESVKIPGYELVEMLHESGPRVIYRALRHDDGEQVILKTLLAEYPHEQDLAEIHREFKIVKRLSIEGVIHVHSLQSYGEGNLAIEMEDFGVPLADYMGQQREQSIDLERFFSIAVGLAKILGQLHENDIIHKDVVPTNILIDSDSGELRLIDFGISSELSRERQSITLSKCLEGTLPYISPEQTGRMNRDVDYRSDYYLLGVTLFELITGELPFTARNTLEWVHRHITQPPPLAHAVNGRVPEQVSRIILKLMSKNAEDRYQSSFGLVTDLERCRDEIERNGTIVSFELGTADVSRRFQISQQLYGRDTELEQIEALFEDVSNGGAGLCLVSGYSGVGKSALVNEFGKSVVSKQGYLIQSKFDKFHQSRAYSAIADAFQGLVQQLLNEPEECLEDWRKSLHEALGTNAQLLINLVPELELIIGEQPPVPDLPPTESQNRFQILVLNFVKVFASRQHPLAMFIDDLQWSDIPTLNLIQRLVTARDLNYFFFVGAYRSNAVDERHPLRVTLNQIQKSHELAEVMLEPLDRMAVTQLMADALHTDLQSCEHLSEVIYEKTQANPLFINQFLKRLNEDACITFDAETGSWNWDIESIQHAEVGDNVVDFLITSLRRLDKSTQQVLQLAACIGGSFDLRTLSIIYEQSMEQTSQALNEALRRNIVLPLNESYRFFGLGSAHEDAGPEPDHGSTDDLNPCYKFQHDRVHQAAYALINSSRKQTVHLSVGRLIQSHSSDLERSERLIEIVEHVNEGRELIDDVSELRQLARLNLEAGIKAQQSSVYRAALVFFQIGQELLTDDAWENDYELMLALGREIQQCTYLTGEHEEADRWTENLLLHARSLLLKAEILSTRTRQYATTGRMRESIQAAFAGLALLGIDMTDSPADADIVEAAAEVRKNLGGRNIPDLIDAPDLTNPEVKVAIHLLMEIFPAAFLSGSGNLFPYLVLNSVNLSLRHGNSPESAFAYAAYGMLLCGVLDDPALGYEYGKLGVAMNERFNDVELKSRIIYVYTMFIHHWNNHWSSMTPWFLKGIEAGYQSGDMLYLAYSAQDCIIWDPKLDLETATREQRKYLTIVKDCEYKDSLDSGTLFLQMQLNYQGLTDGLYSMSDDFFNEAECVEGMQQRRFMTGIANYNIYKAEIHFCYDDYAGALDYIKMQDDLIASSMSLPQLVRFYIVAFLTRTALFKHMSDAEQYETQQRLQTDLNQMKRWAEVCPENFHHLSLMMQAELARLADDMHGALSLYEKAIASAKASEFRRDEALANELAAKCLLGLDLARAADGYLKAAYYLYYRWGGLRKIDHMEKQYPQLLLSTLPKSTGAADTQAMGTHMLDSASMDMGSVMKASQTIAGEIHVKQLWETTMQILLENAGGQMGCFVVLEDGKLIIQAKSEAGSDVPEHAVPLPVEVDGEQPLLPVSVLNNVLRTGTPLVLSEATDSTRFGTDPYIVSQQTKSIMCIPVLRHNKYSGVIYIENNLTFGAFTEERVEVIKLLSAQASISMENARLYEDQVRLTEAQQRFVPSQFLQSLGYKDIARVGLGEHVARDMSVMFADIRDFTPLVERLDPGAVIGLLNRYFSQLGEAITACGGFIDSFNGDEVMALFPLPAEQAVAAGIAMWRALESFNRESNTIGDPVIKMGLGVCTGPLVLGTVGARDRLKCGVVGDAVNLASRIEQLTKVYHTPLLIGEHTYQQLDETEKFSIRMVDHVAVKGKQKAVKLYEVMDAETPERRAAKEATQTQLSNAMQYYYDRDFATAHEIFVEAYSKDPEDAVLSIFIERSQRYATRPPPADWQGFEMLVNK